MKICITAQGKNLDSEVESRFGRSPYFIIYDTETADFKVIENPNISEASGVGVKSGQLMVDKKVSVVLTGKVGPKASDTLEAAGIKIIDNVSGTVKEAIDKYQNESLQTTEKSQEQEIQTGGWFGRGLRRLFGFGGKRGRGRQGRSSGQGRNIGRGPGQGRRGFAGPSGYCVCTNCGEKVKHQPGVPCRSLNCPKCGTIMVRE